MHAQSPMTDHDPAVTARLLERSAAMRAALEKGPELFQAGRFWADIGGQNEALKDQMQENADVFEKVADLVEADPTGELS